MSFLPAFPRFIPVLFALLVLPAATGCGGAPSSPTTSASVQQRLAVVEWQTKSLMATVLNDLATMNDRLTALESRVASLPVQPSSHRPLPGEDQDIPGNTAGAEVTGSGTYTNQDARSSGADPWLQQQIDQATHEDDVPAPIP